MDLKSEDWTGGWDSQCDSLDDFDVIYLFFFWGGVTVWINVG